SPIHPLDFNLPDEDIDAVSTHDMSGKSKQNKYLREGLLQLIVIRNKKEEWNYANPSNLEMSTKDVVVSGMGVNSVTKSLGIGGTLTLYLPKTSSAYVLLLTCAYIFQVLLLSEIAVLAVQSSRCWTLSIQR